MGQFWTVVNSDCKRISISDFKKTNGIQKSDDNYEMSVSYALAVSPPENSAAFKQAIESQAADIDSKIQQAEANISEAEAAPNNGAESASKVLQAHSDLDHLKADKANNRAAAWNELMISCPNIDMNIVSVLSNAKNQLELESPEKQAALEGFITPVITHSIELIKTENGWKVGI